jgi:methylglutamate dehydrogenase subunit D
MNTTATLIPRGPFANLHVLERNSGVTIRGREGLGMATLHVRQRQHATLRSRIREHFGINLPNGPVRIRKDLLAIAGVAPGVWLATLEHGGHSLAGRLRHALGEAASVCDQSDSYAVVRLYGPRVTHVLCSLVPLDLHESTFPVDAVASTWAAHAPIRLWRIENDAEGSPAFDLAVVRSYALSFQNALAEALAESSGPVRASERSHVRR